MSNTAKNFVDSTAKKIAIKPFTYIQQTYDVQKDELDQSDEMRKEDLQHRIAEAEAQLEQLKQEQVDVRAETTKQIEQLRQNWDEEKLQLIAEAEEEGYNAGFESAKEEVYKQYTDMLEQANQLTKIAEEEHIKRIEQSINSLIELSIQIAEKIINLKIEENTNAMESLVKAAIDEVKDQPEIYIYVPAEHYESMLSQKNEFMEVMNGKATVSIYIAPNDECYITHPLGKIDISINTQLSQMRQKLLEIATENQL